MNSWSSYSLQRVAVVGVASWFTRACSKVKHSWEAEDKAKNQEEIPACSTWVKIKFYKCTTDKHRAIIMDSNKES